MPFWSENFSIQGGSALNDPKRKFRFTVSMGGIDATPGGALMWYAKSASKPGFTIERGEHKYLNHTFYYPGSVSWSEIEVTIVDPKDPDMTATIADIINLSGYTPPSNPNSLGSMSKGRAAGAVGQVQIAQLDAEGNEIERWTLWNAFIMDVNFGDLAYGDDDLVEITLKLSYDWARVETIGQPSQATNGSGEVSFFQS